MITTVPAAGPLARLNPLSRLAVSFIITIAALAIPDARALAVLVTLIVAALPMLRLPWKLVVRHGVVVAGLAVSVTFLNAIAAERPGDPILEILWFSVTAGDLAAGVVAGLRVIAIVLPGFLLMVSVDPTDLADALSQRLHLPARFVLPALAAFGLIHRLAQEWRILEAARRARGLGSTSVWGRLRAFPDTVFVLLVSALRHGQRMAQALEGRALGAGPRTSVRESRFSGVDVASVGTVLLACIALVVWARR
jgi:energy-coupling factor transport system permease protein